MTTDFSTLMQGAQTLGANLQAYYDRQRRDRLDKEAKELADKQEKRAQERHNWEATAKRQAKNLADARSYTAQAKSAWNSGKKDQALSLLGKAANLVPNGVDVLEVKDVSRVKPEEKAHFFAANPQLRNQEGNNILAKTFNRVDDREGVTGFKDFNTAYDQIAAALDPKVFMQAEADQKSWVEETNRDATPTIGLDEEGNPTYYVQRAFLGPNGQMRKQNIQLSAEDAMKYDANITNKARRMKQMRGREDEKYRLAVTEKGLDISQKRAGVAKTKAEVAKLEKENGGKGAVKAMKSSDKDSLRKQLVDQLAPRGIELAENAEDITKQVEVLMNYAPQAWQETKGDPAAMVKTIKGMYQRDQKRYLELQKKKAAAAKKAGKKVEKDKPKKEVISKPEEVKKGVGLKQAIPSDMSQYKDKVKLDDSGNVWLISGEQPRRLLRKPSERVYNQRYKNPEYEKYLTALKQMGL